MNEWQALRMNLLSEKVDHGASLRVLRLKKLAVVSEKSRNSSEKCVSQASFLKILDSKKLEEA